MKKVYKMERDITGIAIVEIRRLAKKGLSDRDFNKSCRAILEKLIFDKTNRNEVYIKSLEEKVNDFKEVKRLLNKV